MILSHKQIEEIAAAVTKDFNEFFFGKDADIGWTTARATPIDQFARDYLGLSVSFARLSTVGSLCGLTAYTDTEYTVEEQGVRRTIPLKANQVLLDASFIQPGQVHALCGKRRFTLAHECAHQILFGMESDEVKRAQEKRYAPRIAYGSGDIAGNVVYAFLTFFVMIYLTDTIGLNPGIVGTLMAVAKIFDGISDVIFGFLIDKTHTKMGKARPWMLWPYFGCGVCLFAIFAIPTSWGQVAQYAFCL